MKILFWLYKSRLNTQGKAPVMMRLTYQGQRQSFSTNLFTEPKLWDSKRQRIKGSLPQTKALNNVLKNLTTAAWNKYAETKRSGGLIIYMK